MRTKSEFVGQKTKKFSSGLDQLRLWHGQIVLTVILALMAAVGPLGWGQTAGPHNADQVVLRVYDPLNGALKGNATLSGGSTNPTPHNADQVFLSVYDSVNGAIRINCVLGCSGSSGAITVNGSSAISASTINFESGAATNGLTLTFSNPSAGNIQLGLSGTLVDAGLGSAYSGVGACAANTWASTLTRNTAPTCTQPAFSNISGTVAAAQLPTPTASTLGGVESLAQTSHQWINSISTSGAPTASQPGVADLSDMPNPNVVLAGPSSGSTTAAPTFRALVGADLPNPSSSTLGGVRSMAQTSHQWINSISTSGVPAGSQPAYSDLSGAIYTAWFNGSTSGSAANVFATAANTIYVWTIYPPVPASFNTLNFLISTIDGTAGHYEDIGIAGPCAPGATSCPVVCNVGATQFSSGVDKDLSCTQGTATLSIPTAGAYYYLVTTGNATTAAPLGNSQGRVIGPVSNGTSSTSSTGGALPSMIAIPAASWGVEATGMPLLGFHN